MTQTFPLHIGTIHIIGIGGIGMSGYAEVLHNLGYKVQGSDQAENGNVQRLRARGVRVMVGHKGENIFDTQGVLPSVVVKSTAVKASNPEIVAAQENGVPVIPRVELLTELMRPKWCINISGTHGKTTTTSIIGHVLEKTGLDPTVINGGIINAYATNTRMGASQWMVVEADESDGTFAKLPSIASIITNIDPEHLDYYGSFDKLKEAFVAYAHNLPFYGFVVACIDHPVVAELMPQFQRKTITYGFSEKADIRAVNVQTTPDGLVFDVQFSPHMAHFREPVRGVKLPMFGPHNVLNALTGFAVGHELGIKADRIAAALAQFSGVRRRFTTTGIVNNITVIDDYGHHPAEIAATLKAGRDAINGKGAGRIIAVVQPHRYTRLKSLFDGFCNCFGNADEVIVADVYAAGEEPITGVDKEALVSGIRKSGKDKVHALENPQALAKLIHKIARPGDFVICLGAGSITQWAQALPKELEQLAGTAPQKANGA
ncbi:MAG: UDP-N-acetylmuramate--L-alanine ligase [Alphaproteobacteria bacterium]|nr:UDP-N-acetylmuramate--L-alanine ligase [Alphaproteobacteria bacterium]MDE2337089.1 UDP-N-acetylmuramate--L-alanine ligase [Alphaproteobacteria bacterium]